MSHIVTIKTQIRDRIAIDSACRRLKLDRPEEGKFKLFSGEVTGIAVRFPDWRYPVVCNTQTATLHFDNFEGRWGDQKHLDRFMQAYAVEKAKIEARRKGHTATETQLSDGSIRLTIQVAGGTA